MKLVNTAAELSIAGEQRIVLSPRRVMHEIAYYVPNFNLTSQQVLSRVSFVF